MVKAAQPSTNLSSLNNDHIHQCGRMDSSSSFCWEKSAVGQQRYLSGLQHLLLFQRTWVRFLVPRVVAHNCLYIQLPGMWHLFLASEVTMWHSHTHLNNKHQKFAVVEQISDSASFLPANTQMQSVTVQNILFIWIYIKYNNIIVSKITH